MSRDRGQAHCPCRGTIKGNPQDRGKPGVAEVQTESQCDTIVTVMVAIGVGKWWELKQGLCAGTQSFVKNFCFILMGGHWRF